MSAYLFYCDYMFLSEAIAQCEQHLRAIIIHLSSFGRNECMVNLVYKRIEIRFVAAILKRHVGIESFATIAHTQAIVSK